MSWVYRREPQQAAHSADWSEIPLVYYRERERTHLKYAWTVRSPSRKPASTGDGFLRASAHRARGSAHLQPLYLGGQKARGAPGKATAQGHMSTGRVRSVCLITKAAHSPRPYHPTNKAPAHPRGLQLEEWQVSDSI